MLHTVSFLNLSHLVTLNLLLSTVALTGSLGLPPPKEVMFLVRSVFLSVRRISGITEKVVNGF